MALVERIRLPAQETQETRVQPPGRADPLEEMRACSGILPWEIPWTEEPGGLHSIELQRTGHNRAQCC